VAHLQAVWRTATPRSHSQKPEVPCRATICQTRESSKSAEDLERSQSGNQEGATGNRAGLGGAGLVVP
jgi:hypothetical protein